MKLKERYREFKEWQHRPYQVAPLLQEVHTCTTCDTCYQGNYCPRCGQSSRIGRYSLKTAFCCFLTYGDLVIVACFVVFATCCCDLAI